MNTLTIDDDTATLLNQLSEQQHISPAQLVKHLLDEYREDLIDFNAAEQNAHTGVMDDQVSLFNYEQ